MSAVTFGDRPDPAQALGSHPSATAVGRGTLSLAI